jgi:hypothetical protein
MSPNTPGPASPETAGPPFYGLDPADIPNLDELVTEDDSPADSIFAEKQQRLLTEPLYSSWTAPVEGGAFLELANVGWFYKWREPPLVPDVLLSLGVAPVGDLRSKEGRSYFQWLIGDPPQAIIEIVSDKRGGEESVLMRTYARLAVLYYVIFDPDDLLGHGVLRAFVLSRGKYESLQGNWFPEIGLGLTLWTDTFEGQQQTWLRWCDKDRRVIPTGAERAERDAERAERLAAQLRALGGGARSLKGDG